MAKCTFFGNEELEKAVDAARSNCSTADSSDGAANASGSSTPEQQRADKLLKAVSMLCLEPGFANNFPPLDFDAATDYNFQENMINVSR
jgi:hypothetical protein